MDKLAAFSRLAPVPLHLHVNAVRFCWALCALLALRGICADILRKKKQQRNVRLLCTLCGSARRKQEQMAAAGQQMVTSKPAEACLAGPLALAWLRCRGHHQCLRQRFAPHVARLANRTSLTSRGAMLLMRFMLAPFCGKACKKRNEVSVTVCATRRAAIILRMLAGSSPSCLHAPVCSFAAQSCRTGRWCHRVPQTC